MPILLFWPTIVWSLIVARFRMWHPRSIEQSQPTLLSCSMVVSVPILASGPISARSWIPTCRAIRAVGSILAEGLMRCLDFSSVCCSVSSRFAFSRASAFCLCRSGWVRAPVGLDLVPLVELLVDDSVVVLGQLLGFGGVVDHLPVDGRPYLLGFCAVGCEPAGLGGLLRGDPSSGGPAVVWSVEQGSSLEVVQLEYFPGDCFGGRDFAVCLDFDFVCRGVGL